MSRRWKIKIASLLAIIEAWERDLPTSDFDGFIRRDSSSASMRKFFVSNREN